MCVVGAASTLHHLLVAARAAAVERAERVLAAAAREEGRVTRDLNSLAPDAAVQVGDVGEGLVVDLVDG